MTFHDPLTNFTICKLHDNENRFSTSRKARSKWQKPIAYGKGHGDHEQWNKE